MSTQRIRLLLDSGAPRFVSDLMAMPDANRFEMLSYVGEGEEAIGQLIGDVDAIYIYQHFLTGDLIRSAPRLKFIQKHGLNCKNIDLKTAAERGIPVATLPLLRNATVAEQALALMLACARRIVVGHHAVTSAIYREKGLEPIRTSQRQIRGNWAEIEVAELQDAAVGLIGLGDIGMEIAKRCRAFGMEIFYHQRQRHAADVEARFEAHFLPFDELLARVDYLVLVLPHTEESEGLIDRSALALMKPSATLINVARGAIVDQDALVEALKQGRIAMAGLDVYREEPLPVDNPLMGLPNVVLTPHLGGGSGRSRSVDRSAGLSNILSFFDTGQARGVINFP